MAGRRVTPDDLTRLLERFSIDAGRARTAAEAGEAQLQLVIARIAELTEALRDAEENETARLAARVLLGDLAHVAAQFRARANDAGASVATAHEHRAEALRLIGPLPPKPLA